MSLAKHAEKHKHKQTHMCFMSASWRGTWAVGLSGCRRGQPAPVAGAGAWHGIEEHSAAWCDMQVRVCGPRKRRQWDELIAHENENERECVGSCCILGRKPDAQEE